MRILTVAAIGAAFLQASLATAPPAQASLLSVSKPSAVSKATSTAKTTVHRVTSSLPVFVTAKPVSTPAHMATPAPLPAGRDLKVSTSSSTTSIVPKVQVLTGKVTAIKNNTLSVSSKSGRSGTITLPAKGVSKLKLRVGSTIATVSTDAGKTVRVFSVVASAVTSLPAGASRLLGTVSGIEAKSLLFRTIGGETYQLQCGACSGPLISQLLSAPMQAVFAVASSDGTLLSLAPLANGTQILGEIVAFDPGELVLLTPDGQMAELQCACAGGETGGLALGDQVIVDVDPHARISRMMHVPQSGLLVGTIAAFAASYIKLRTLDGAVHTLRCNCAGGTLNGVPLHPAMRVVAAIGSVGEIASLAPLSRGDRIIARVRSISLHRITLRLDSGGLFTMPVTSGTTLPFMAPGTPVQAAVNTDGTLASIAIETRCPTSVNIRDDAETCQRWAEQQQTSHVDLFSGDYGTDVCLSRTASVVNVHVRSATTGLPLFHAIVHLEGSSATARLLTAQDGTAIFQDVPAGQYRVVIGKAGLHAAASAPFSVRCRSSVALRAVLAPVRQLAVRP